MKKKVSLTVLGLVLVGVLASHVSWEEKDNGHLLVLDGREVDLLGALRNSWNRVQRRCDRVQVLTRQDANFVRAQQVIQTYSPPQSGSAQVAGVWSLGEWRLVEVEFAQLLPAVVLMRTQNGVTHIVPQAVWSGYTRPWAAAPHIRRYLSAQSSEAPIDLIDCFEPQSVSFN